MMPRVARAARLLAVLLCAACVKRYAPPPLEERTVLSGVPAVFGADQGVPDGVEVRWDFGDGTPAVVGARVEHAFPRQGAFKVTQTVRDSDGQVRTFQSSVTVLRRAVTVAIPADARAALILEVPWSRIALHRQTAARLDLRDFFDETARGLSEALGFDALDPQAAQAHGFDPDEGIALFTVPQDPEALVAAVGTSDDAKALAAVRRMLMHERGAHLAGAPFTLSEVKQLPGGSTTLLGVGRSGERIAVVQRYGYLYMRLPSASDPMVALAGVLALPPDRGLRADPAFLAAVKHVGSGDVVFYSRASEKAAEARVLSAQNRGAFAFALRDGPALVEVRLFAQLHRLGGAQLQDALRSRKDPPDIAARLPAGPAAYVKLSGAPAAFWQELSQSDAAGAARLRERIQQALGLDVARELLPAFTGNVGVAVYLDASALLEAALGEEVASFDRSSFLLAAELTPEGAQTVQKAFDRAAGSGQRRALTGGAFWRLRDGAMEAAVKDGFLFLAIGGPGKQAAPSPPPVPRRKGKKPARPAEPTPPSFGALAPVLEPAPSHPTLSEVLESARVRGFDLPADQIAWLDIQGIANSLRAAAEDQGGVAGAGVRLLADRLSGLRDALIEARPSVDGIEAEILLRFQGPRPDAASQRN